jgi:hypothetical protein
VVLLPGEHYIGVIREFIIAMLKMRAHEHKELPHDARDCLVKPPNCLPDVQNF